MREYKQLARTITDGVPDDARLARARAFCFAVIDSYWQRTCHGGPIGFNARQRCPVKLDRPLADHGRLALRIGQEAAELPKPVAAYLISMLYTAMLSETMRSKYGVFFTPPPLVERLLDLVEEAGFDWRSGTVLDPASGGGAFISPVATRIAEVLRRDGHSSAAIVEAVATRVSGIEIDPFSGWMAHVFLEVALWDDILGAERRMPNVVMTGDSLEANLAARGPVDLVIGNPPYGKVTPPPALRARFARSLFGHANLYGLFTDLAIQLTGAGGIIGFVTPTSFLGGQYFKNLRALLAEEAPPTAIDFIGDRADVFDDVLQETVLTVYRRPATASVRKAPTARKRKVGAASQLVVHLNTPSTLEQPCSVEKIGTFSLPGDGSAPWMLPRDTRHVALLRAAERMPSRLADYGMGVSTGPLVWNRHKPQLADKPGRNRVPLIWAESVLSSGEFRFSAVRRNHEPYFELLEGQEHLATRTPCVLVQRTTAKEQDRRLVAAGLPVEMLRDHGAVVIENHLNMVRPLDPKDRVTAGPGSTVSIAAITAFLNSDVADALFRCISGSVAVSAYELESLPMPGPTTMHLIDQMIAQGASDAELNRAFTAAYRVAPARSTPRPRRTPARGGR